MKQIKITRKQLRVLNALRENPDATYETLKDICQFKYVGSIQSALKHLIKKGFIAEKEKHTWKILK